MNNTVTNSQFIYWLTDTNLTDSNTDYFLHSNLSGSLTMKAAKTET